MRPSTLLAHIALSPLAPVWETNTTGLMLRFKEEKHQQCDQTHRRALPVAFYLINLSSSHFAAQPDNMNTQVCTTFEHEGNSISSGTFANTHSSPIHQSHVLIFSSHKRWKYNRFIYTWHKSVWLPDQLMWLWSWWKTIILIVIIQMVACGSNLGVIWFYL